MHRQSLGSPASKLHLQHAVALDNGVVVINENSPIVKSETQKLIIASSSSSISAISVASQQGDNENSSEGKEEEEASKSQKSKRKFCKPKTPEKYIHLIPLLTLLCFLILYFSSHDPSQSDLAQFSGFKPLSRPRDEEFERILDIKKGDVLAIRSLKNLETGSKRRLHRKMPRI